MRRLGWAACGLGGVILGGISTALMLGALPLPFGSGRPIIAPERVPTRALGDALMYRVTKTFVADSRTSTPAAHGVTFFDQPTPAGEFFCLVRTYRVPAEVVSGRTPERYEGSLETGEAYGLWIDPQEAGRMGRDELQRTRTLACADYRDFEHMITEKDPLAASGGLEFLAAAQAAARDGQLSARTSCRSDHEELAGRPCDALAYLRTVDLKSVRFAETLADHIGSDPVPWRVTYRLNIPDGDVGGHPALTMITIQGRHSPGMKVHSIESVTIERLVA